MKRYILSMMLATMFVPAFAAAQEEGPEDIEFQMELRGRELELQQQEAEMDIERKMQELELEKRKIELEHMRRPKEHPIRLEQDDDDDDDELHPILLLLAVVHILCAVWVYQDIRRRAGGSGIWIVIALLTGLLGTLVYAVVRLGENQKSQA
jgi:hypothetical protein